MTHCVARIRTPQGAVVLRCCSSGLCNLALSKVVKNEGPKKVRPRSDAATDGDRWGA